MEYKGGLGSGIGCAVYAGLIFTSGGIFWGDSFAYGVVTPDKSNLPSWMEAYIFFIEGKIGADSFLNGGGIASLRAGLLDVTFHTPKWFKSLSEDSIFNPNVYLGYSTFVGELIIGSGIKATLEAASLSTGLRFGKFISVGIKGFVGAECVFNLNNGFEFGGGIPYGVVFSFKVDLQEFNKFLKGES